MKNVLGIDSLAKHVRFHCNLTQNKRMKICLFDFLLIFLSRYVFLLEVCTKDTKRGNLHYGKCLHLSVSEHVILSMVMLNIHAFTAAAVWALFQIDKYVVSHAHLGVSVRRLYFAWQEYCPTRKTVAYE